MQQLPRAAPRPRADGRQHSRQTGHAGTHDIIIISTACARACVRDTDSCVRACISSSFSDLSTHLVSWVDAPAHDRCASILRHMARADVASENPSQHGHTEYGPRAGHTDGRATARAHPMNGAVPWGRYLLVQYLLRYILERTPKTYR
eukprot:COSAG01_NODE_2744_length_7150_cov_5.435116_6_plen_148_part_00